MSTYRRALAGLLVAGLVLAGCTGPEPAAVEPEPEPVRLYGTDATMANSFAAELPDRTVLAGMKGTAPLNPLPAAFVNRLRDHDPELTDFVFAGETYDAVVISALAAELAGVPDPGVVRDYLVAVTTDGEQCRAVADCLELARDGEQLDYRGISLRRGGFTDLGEPAAATYATRHFGVDGFIDDEKTEYVGAGDLAATSTAEPPEPGERPTGPVGLIEPLIIGGLLPETGDLNFVYPAMIAAAMLAIEDINDAGGVFGVDVEWVDGDDGSTDPEVARATLASHVEEGVHVVIGAAGSGTTAEVLPDAVAAGLIMVSPSNTEAELSRAEHDGYYFRTAPSDDLQGAALADIMLRDGVNRIAVVARDDPYGRGLLGYTEESLLRFGVPPSDLTLLTYSDPEQEGGPIPELGRLIAELVAAEPDAVLLIGFGEAVQVIQRLAEQGLLGGG